MRTGVRSSFDGIDLAVGTARSAAGVRLRHNPVLLVPSMLKLFVALSPLGLLVACGQGTSAQPEPSATVTTAPSSSASAPPAAPTFVPSVSTSSTSPSPSASSAAPTSSSTGLSTSVGDPSTSGVASDPTSMELASSATEDGDGSTTDATSSLSTQDSVADPSSAAVDFTSYAQGFHELSIHDECTSVDPASDVCPHAMEHEESFTFGGDASATYDVTLRVRGLFEPTNIAGGETPYAEHPYFKVGGTVTKTDYSQWQIRVSEPAATFYLNHYPTTGHTIYKEDFEVTIPVRGGSAVVVRVEDSNDRQIDNGYEGPPDRRQTLEGVTDGVVHGQVLRLDVLGVAVQ